MNTVATGEVTEGVVLAALLKAGEAVLIPFGNNKRYDLAIDVEGRLVRLQCKTARLRNGCLVWSPFSIHTVTHKRTGYVGQIEYFMVYAPDNDKIYRIPVEEVSGASHVTMRIDPAKNNQSKGLRMASKYEYSESSITW